MEAFPALVQSFGELCLTYIGKENLSRLYVYADEGNGSIYVEIFLADNTWDEQARTIDKMIELREMFLDELAVDYRFVIEDSSTVEAATARGPVMAFV